MTHLGMRLRADVSLLVTVCVGVLTHRVRLCFDTLSETEPSWPASRMCLVLKDDKHGKTHRQARS